jgi:UDP-GlcNAc3NAcA epimerase
MSVLKLLYVVGSRPQFPKAAAVARAVAAHNAASPSMQITERLLHTGQHYDDGMSDIFFRELQLRRPDFNLQVGSGSLGYQTARSLEGIFNVLGEWTPDWVIVFGDTNATLAGAIAAQQRHLQVAHVEAGIRTGNLHQAEELSRVVVDRISNLRFACTAHTLRNLGQENLVDNSFNTGDTMLDNYLYFLPSRAMGFAESLGLTPNRYIYATIHRAENTDDAGRLAAIIDTLVEAQASIMPLVLPLHPRTRAAIETLGRTGELEAAGVKVIEPVAFSISQALLEDSQLVFSDSGGLLREACYSGRYCVIPWEYTAWPEISEAGMASSGPVETSAMLSRLQTAPGPRERHGSGIFGNGSAGKQIVQHIMNTVR